MFLTQTQMETLILPEWQQKLERSLYAIKNTYPGGNTDLLGRQLIVKLNLKEGHSAMKQGVLYQVIGKMKDSKTLALYILQPYADTCCFEINLEPYDTLFIQRNTEEWK